MNRKALAQFFRSGLIYTRHGARLGRDLLLAHQHQHLIKVRELLAQLSRNDGEAEAPEGETELLYKQVQVLLARTGELTARSEAVLARER